MTTIAARRTPRPTVAELAREIADVAGDLPLFLTSSLYRIQHLRWGATAAEFASALPGDELQSHAQFECTRAVTVDAPPAAVWPWLVQVGCLKGAEPVWSLGCAHFMTGRSRSARCSVCC